MQAPNKTALHKKIMECKLNTPVEKLCKNLVGEGKHSSKWFNFRINFNFQFLISPLDVFITYIKYCRNLRFEEEPDYIWIKNLFRNLYFKKFEKWDNVFDWNYKHVNFTFQNNTFSLSIEFLFESRRRSIPKWWFWWRGYRVNWRFRALHTIKVSYFIKWIKWHN